MTSGIYQIINVTNGKIYVGSSKNMEKRWIDHRGDLRRNKHHSSYLQHSWNKHGSSNFELQILEVCQPEDLVTIEQYYLDWLEPFGERGYNICLTANAPMKGRKSSLVTRAKISTALKGRKYGPVSKERKEKLRIINIGKKLTKETKMKMSISRMGHPGYTKGRPAWNKSVPQTEEHRRKNSKSHKGLITGEKHWNYGKHISKEHKEKLRIACTGRPPLNKGQPSPLKGKPLSQEHIAKIKAAIKGRPSNNKGKPMSEKQKEKLRKTKSCNICKEKGHNKLTCPLRKLYFLVTNGLYRIYYL